MSTNDGGPAFPVLLQMKEGDGSNDTGAQVTDIHYWNEGLSLRDYFAAKALAGLLANPHLSGWSEKLNQSGDAARASAARSAYDTADAMLAARAKGKA